MPESRGMVAASESIQARILANVQKLVKES